MPETKRQLKERLQAEGVWEDFLALRQQLVGDGLTPAQARKEALGRIEARLAQQSERPGSDRPRDPPPVTGPAQPATAERGPDFTRHLPNHEAAQWVAENLANANVRPQDAPNGLAWGLLQWVRLTPANQATFWGSIWPKLLPTAAALKRGQEAEAGKAGDKEGPCPECGREPEPVDVGSERAEALIQELLDEMDAEQADEDAELAARPDAAQIGATLQHSLKAALDREEMWKKQAGALRERVRELESVGVPKTNGKRASG
jgi:hypothetical protein